MAIPDEYREEVYRFIWNVVQKEGCKLTRIGGIANHIHMLVELSPEKSLSSLLRSVKSESSGWMQRERRFTHFTGWAHEYFAATVSPRSRNAVIKYIDSQQEHHKKRDFRKELEEIYELAGVHFDERDMQ